MSATPIAAVAANGTAEAETDANERRIDPATGEILSPTRDEYAIRPQQATAADVDWMKGMVDRHRQELGFVRRASLVAGCIRGEVLAVPPIGFVHFHRRRDGWHTIYELVSEAGVGRLLLDAVPRPVRLKCPEELAANLFYRLAGGTLTRREPGKRRPLNVWEWR